MGKLFSALFSMVPLSGMRWGLYILQYCILFHSVPSLGSFSGTNSRYSGIFLLSCMKILRVREDLSVDFSHLPQILSILPIHTSLDGFSNYFNSQIIIIRKMVTSHIIVWCH